MLNFVVVLISLINESNKINEIKTSNKISVSTVIWSTNLKFVSLLTKPSNILNEINPIFRKVLV